MNESGSEIAQVLNQLKSNLEHFPTLEDLSTSDIVEHLRITLTGQVWKDHSLGIDDALFRGKVMAGDGEFGAAETDADILPIFIRRGLEDKAVEILATYDVRLNNDEWHTLRAWARGDLEAQRLLNWLNYCHHLLQRQIEQLAAVLGENKLKMARGKLHRLRTETDAYANKLQQNPVITMDRTESQAKGAIEALLTILQRIYTEND